MFVISVMDTIDEDELVVFIEERLGVEARVAVIMNFNNDGINEYDEMVNAHFGSGLYTYTPNKFDLDLKNRETLLDKSSIEEPPVLKLKALSSHLCYAF